MGLSSAQLGAVEGLVRTAPDGLLSRLNAALSAARHGDPVFAPVSDIARAEAEQRRARDIVLSPLKALSQPAAAPKRPLLAGAELGRIWRVIRAVQPDQAKLAVFVALGPANNDPTPPIYDALCLAAAAALRGPEADTLAPFWSEAERLRLAKLLMLAPVLRAVAPRLGAWTRNLNIENMAALRLAFKDAIATDEDIGPVFMEALQLQLAEPCQILRIISAVMDRPSDRYLAASELAGLGERLLDDVDRRVQGVKTFDPDRGIEGGVAEAASVQIACQIIKEFEQWLALGREGPWGARVAAQKLALALAAEARMREADRAVTAALPLQPQRAAAGGVPLRPTPRLDEAPDAARVRRAAGLLAFLDETRVSASNAGFGALRAKVIEALEIRMDTYVEDLLELLHGPQHPDRVQARAFLEIAADVMGLLRGPKAAQIVRRRGAAA
jgi:hypothetical protein